MSHILLQTRDIWSSSYISVHFVTKYHANLWTATITKVSLFFLHVSGTPDYWIYHCLNSFPFNISTSTSVLQNTYHMCVCVCVCVVRVTSRQLMLCKCMRALACAHKHTHTHTHTHAHMVTEQYTLLVWCFSSSSFSWSEPSIQKVLISFHSELCICRYWHVPIETFISIKAET